MFQRNKEYKFITVNDAVLNQSFSGVRIQGPVNYKVASREVNVATRHALLWPYVPNKNQYSEDITKHDFYIIDFPNGNTTALSEAWIVKESIEEVKRDSKRYRFTFDSPEQERDLKAYLARVGITFKVE